VTAPTVRITKSAIFPTEAKACYITLLTDPY
jgi:hypothetical protein